MNNCNYMIVSGTVFGLVAVFHLIRTILNWPLIIGSWDAPHWFSIVVVILTGGLSIWAFRLARR